MTFRKVGMIRNQRGSARPWAVAEIATCDGGCCPSRAAARHSAPTTSMPVRLRLAQAAAERSRRALGLPEVAAPGGSRPDASASVVREARSTSRSAMSGRRRSRRRRRRSWPPRHRGWSPRSDRVATIRPPKRQSMQRPAASAVPRPRTSTRESLKGLPLSVRSDGRETSLLRGDRSAAADDVASAPCFGMGYVDTGGPETYKKRSVRGDNPFMCHGTGCFAAIARRREQEAAHHG